MGNIEQGKSKAMVLSEVEDESELNFYIEVEDPNLGAAKIYNCRKMPLCYILKEDRIVHDSKIYNMLKKILNWDID